MRTDAVANYFDDSETEICASCGGGHDQKDWSMCDCCARFIHAHHNHDEQIEDGVLHILWRKFVTENGEVLTKTICSDCFSNPFCYHCTCSIPTSEGYPCWHIFAVVRGRHKKKRQAAPYQRNPSSIES